MVCWARGGRIGLETAGLTCVGFCEFDKFAVASYTSMHLITDEQRERLSQIDKKKRPKEILKEEYRNGEWYRSDIREVKGEEVPRADVWLFGSPCVDFSIAGNRAGLGGDKSSLIREIFRLLREVGEENRPEWLIYENVKGMFSSNKGFDYLTILLEMESFGYDIGWQLFNSQYFGVPQHRERVYTVGHLRARGFRKILPVEGADCENRVGVIGHRNGYRRNTQVFDPERLTEALDTAQGGGRGHYTVEIIGTCNPDRHSQMNVYGIDGVVPTLDTMHEPKRIAVTVHEDGTLLYKGIPARVRKLTPKECFRLQGWNDDYYEKAAFVNSDSQLYKQAGNGMTATVVEAIGRKIIECQ